VEWDLLDLLPETGGHTSDTPASSEASAGSPGAPHDAPSAVELLQAVREFLESDVVPATEGRLRFHARVAANVAGMVGREIELGPAQAVAHGRRLAQLGMADDAALARAIRAGELDGRLAEVTSIVRAGVADKLRVANPAYLTPALDDGR